MTGGSCEVTRRLVRWGTISYRLLRRDRRPGVIILAYHRIGDHTPGETDIAAPVFERQMRYVRRHFDPISLDEVVRITSQARSVTRDSIVITFDDGCVETYEIAYPILRRYEIPSTIYVPAAYVEQGRAFDFGIFRTGDWCAYEHARGFFDHAAVRRHPGDRGLSCRMCLTIAKASLRCSGY